MKIMTRHVVVLSWLVALATANFNNVSNMPPECLITYYKMRMQPLAPRTFKYFHETFGDVHPIAHNTDYSFRIVKGRPISITEAPYTVMYGPYCTGTLIDPMWVLTSAHCKQKWDYITGGTTRRSLGIRYGICEHFTHPMWGAPNKLHSHDYDYQLMLLDKPVQVSDSFRPVALGTTDMLRTPHLFTITGWGHTHYKGQMQEILQRGFIPYIDTEKCLSLHLQYYDITPRMFCAGYLNSFVDTCQGDSGGPVVYNGFLVGCVSFGVKCADYGKPAVYANVMKARDWIRKVTQLPL